MLFISYCDFILLLNTDAIMKDRAFQTLSSPYLAHLTVFCFPNNGTVQQAHPPQTRASRWVDRQPGRPPAPSAVHAGRSWVRTRVGRVRGAALRPVVQRLPSGDEVRAIRPNAGLQGDDGRAVTCGSPVTARGSAPGEGIRGVLQRPTLRRGLRLQLCLSPPSRSAVPARTRLCSEHRAAEDPTARPSPPHRGLRARPG
jgi:hypothetical protein